jgi:signal transduction histidine kinase
VSEVLESAVSLVAPRATEQRVGIVRDETDELPPVSADAHYLMRAFLNLLVNALDVMPAGGILSLETARSEEGDIRVTIGDTGPGIESEDAEALFRPFETKKPGGTGLGLGIVRRIVEFHSGTVTLRPGKGGGTEAVVTLPAVAGETCRGEVHG